VVPIAGAASAGTSGIQLWILLKDPLIDADRYIHQEHSREARPRHSCARFIHACSAGGRLWCWQAS
jgi:hypothetical protein